MLLNTTSQVKSHLEKVDHVDRVNFYDGKEHFTFEIHSSMQETVEKTIRMQFEQYSASVETRDDTVVLNIENLINNL
jgi:hypothetical protein